MRKLLIAANWKMHKTPIESTAFLTSFFPLIKNNTTAVHARRAGMRDPPWLSAPSAWAQAASRIAMPMPLGRKYLGVKTGATT